eukprot:8071715-Pyramimonas_sp.AAC.1
MLGRPQRAKEKHVAQARNRADERRREGVELGAQVARATGRTVPYDLGGFVHAGAPAPLKRRAQVARIINISRLS